MVRLLEPGTEGHWDADSSDRRTRAATLATAVIL